MDEVLEAWYAAHDHPMKRLAPERACQPAGAVGLLLGLQSAAGVVLELFEFSGRLLAAAIGPGIKAFGDGLSVGSAKISNGRDTAKWIVSGWPRFKHNSPSRALVMPG